MTCGDLTISVNHPLNKGLCYLTISYPLNLLGFLNLRFPEPHLLNKSPSVAPPAPELQSVDAAPGSIEVPCSLPVGAPT